MAATEGRTVDWGSVRVRLERAVQAPAGTIAWQIVSYQSSDGPCLDVYAELAPGEDSGGLVSCGKPDAPFGLGIGGLEFAGNLYNVVYGEAPAGATAMRVVLGDGTVLTRAVTNGVFFILVPGEDFDVSKVEAVNRKGTSVASIEPPSIQEARQKAIEQAQTQTSTLS